MGLGVPGALIFKVVWERPKKSKCEPRRREITGLTVGGACKTSFSGSFFGHCSRFGFILNFVGFWILGVSILEPCWRNFRSDSRTDFSISFLMCFRISLGRARNPRKRKK